MMLDSGCLMLADEKPHAAIQYQASCLTSDKMLLSKKTALFCY
jgi:hypothetical protein